jgi:hypothetical protein
MSTERMRNQVINTPKQKLRDFLNLRCVTRA